MFFFFCTNESQMCVYSAVSSDQVLHASCDRNCLRASLSSLSRLCKISQWGDPASPQTQGAPVFRCEIRVDLDIWVPMTKYILSEITRYMLLGPQTCIKDQDVVIDWGTFFECNGQHRGNAEPSHLICFQVGKNRFLHRSFPSIFDMIFYIVSWFWCSFFICIFLLFYYSCVALFL